MTWSYDETDLDKTTASGRLNVVRLLLGDTDTTDQLIQDEEINFYLSENSDDVYGAAVDAAESLAAKFARDVNRQVGDLAIEAETKMVHFVALAERLRKQARKSSPRGGIFIGNDKDQRLFNVGMHDNGNAEFRPANDTEDDVVGNY